MYNAYYLDVDAWRKPLEVDAAGDINTDCAPMSILRQDRPTALLTAVITASVT